MLAGDPETWFEEKLPSVRCDILSHLQPVLNFSLAFNVCMAHPIQAVGQGEAAICTPYMLPYALVMRPILRLLDGFWLLLYIGELPSEEDERKVSQ